MTEKDWSDRLSDLLRGKGCFVQRIESGSTGRGIPDMFVVKKPCESIWIENKIMSLDRDVIRQLENGIECKVRIPWRPGQLAWHDRVHNAITVLTITRIVGTGYVLVTPMNKYVGGVRNAMTEGYATVMKYDDEYLYGITTNDTYMYDVVNAVEHICNTKWE